MPSRFPDSGQFRDVIPEPDRFNPQTIPFQSQAKSVDLCAFPGTINTGKANKAGSADLSKCIHYSAPRLLPMPFVWCQLGRLGLARESATTVPMATAPPTITPTLIRMERARRCFAGAITAPAGLEAATPVVFSYGAAAEPTGLWALSC
jgi:hypothetical protein